MKKTAIVFGLLLIMFSTYAQQTHFGLKGGVNISQLHFNDEQISSDSKVGLHFGVLAHIHASKTWAVQPELLYSLEGAQKVGNSRVNHKLSYLNIPVLLQYMFDNGFRIEGGPQIGFLLKARTKTGNVTIDRDDFESVAISIPLGIGYLTSSGFGVDARYVFGLSNIFESKNPEIQSNVFQLGIFYQLSDPKIHAHRK